MGTKWSVIEKDIVSVYCCDFCKRSSEKVANLVVVVEGTAAICNECIADSVMGLKEQFPEKYADWAPLGQIAIDAPNI